MMNSKWLEDPWKDLKKDFQDRLLKDVQQSAFEEYYINRSQKLGEHDYKIPYSHQPVATKEEIRHYRDHIERLELENNRRRLGDLEKEMLRQQNPALQDAWEKYQILLKLVDK